MASVIAALKKGPGRQLAQNILSHPLSKLFPVDAVGAGALGYKLGFNIVPEIPPCVIDIKPNGQVTAFVVCKLYARYIECSIDINKIIREGEALADVCLIPWFGGRCKLRVTIKMPHVGRITVRLNASDVGLTAVPIAAFDTYFAVKDIFSADRDGNDKRVLKAHLSLLPSPQIHPNDYLFAQMLVAAIAQYVIDRLSGIPVLGPILKYVGGFLSRIANGIYTRLGAVQAWVDFVQAEVLQAVLANIGSLWDPTIKVKIGSIPSRFSLASEYIAPGGQRQPPVYLELDSISFDVNTSCPAGPELRAKAALI